MAHCNLDTLLRGLIQTLQRSRLRHRARQSRHTLYSIPRGCAVYRQLVLRVAVAPGWSFCTVACLALRNRPQYFRREIGVVIGLLMDICRHILVFLIANVGLLIKLAEVKRGWMIKLTSSACGGIQPTRASLR
jgi:hypothetical protein